jgi:hypothetical protein
VAADGGIFAYGDAQFYGSTGNLRLNRPIVGMAATPDGRGYWLVASDGGVFAFGDAAFYGSTGGITLPNPSSECRPLRAVPATSSWPRTAESSLLVMAAMPGGSREAPPVVGIANNPAGPGYWELAQDGTVATFGGASIVPNVSGSGSAVGIFATASGSAPPSQPAARLPANSPATVAAYIGAIVATLPVGFAPPGWTWQVEPSLSENVDGVTVTDSGQTSWGDPPVSAFSASALSSLTESEITTIVWHEWANAVVMSRVQTTDWADVPTSAVPWAAQAEPLLQGASSGCEIIDEASDSLTAALGGSTEQGCGGTATPSLDAALLADIRATAPGYAS